ncbi:glycosyltransferase [Oceanobacillus kimchii]|uniref:glycosyltransferase n=1 Tax=Oceanobacillus kimchii TaxID=746691 RepID=UPI0021A33120|nr:glycosyltransferase [Oceanobacillus kimchii]MCT1579224.1 glycosyltransferase [Oceanobacillus kimchii]MCT2134644.1 glycosyltransferase [Oceanobacillus kimchii]
MKNIFMLVHELKENKGGMTSAMFNRSTEFYNCGFNADIITFDYNRDYSSTINNLKKNGKMDQRTIMYNIIEYYDKKSSMSDTSQNRELYNSYIKQNEDLIVIPDSENTYRLFDPINGDYLFYVKKKNNQVIFMDQFKNNTRIKRIHFKSELVKHIEMFNLENKLHAEILFNENGYPFISRKIHPEKQSIGNTYLFEEKLTFKNNLEFSRYFLNELVEDKASSVLICDGPGSFPKILELKLNNVQKYAVIHVNHYENYTEDGSIKKQEKFIFENYNEIDGIIVLTKKQKIELQNTLRLNNLYVIPNFVKNNPTPTKHSTQKIVGHISRLSKEKGFDRMIEVARKVISQDNEIEFHLYGTGPYKKEIQRMIDNARLQDKVLLKGYTNDTPNTLKTFRCVISTSYFEGQGLSIIEAMEQCIPVIAFDIKYGPSDIINDRKNGFLIPDNNIDEMAERILHLTNKENHSQRLGKKAREAVLTTFNNKDIKDKWLELFKINSK